MWAWMSLPPASFGGHVPLLMRHPSSSSPPSLAFPQVSHPPFPLLCPYKVNIKILQLRRNLCPLLLLPPEPPRRGLGWKPNATEDIGVINHPLSNICRPPKAYPSSGDDDLPLPLPLLAFCPVPFGQNTYCRQPE